MGWKVYVHMQEGDAGATNACVFATKDEAHRAGVELLSRWLAPYDFSVRESDEKINYHFPMNAPRPESLP